MYIYVLCRSMYSACIVIAYLLPALCISAKQKNMASGCTLGSSSCAKLFRYKTSGQNLRPRLRLFERHVLSSWFRRWPLWCLTRLRCSRRSWPHAASLHSFSKAMPEAGCHVYLGKLIAFFWWWKRSTFKWKPRNHNCTWFCCCLCRRFSAVWTPWA